MADVNSKPELAPAPVLADAAPGAAEAKAAEPVPFDIIELLFFAYRDFVGDPDALLREYDFGRAHHRVLHFVNRNPGIRVTELLDILKITKQSLGRVLKQLVDSGFIEQRPGPQDRRQRLLYATDKGRSLALRLSEPQSRRISRALSDLGPAGREQIVRFLSLMVNPEDRGAVAALIDRADRR